MRLPGQEHSGAAAAIILERFCKQNVVIQGRGDELAERDGTNYFEKIYHHPSTIILIDQEI